MKKNKEEVEFNSILEFESAFFPKAIKQKESKRPFIIDNYKEDPNILGDRLAKDSISKMKQCLKEF